MSRKGPDYTCEWCKNVLSDRGVGDDHISLPIAPGGGRASMQGPLPGWRIVAQLKARTYHWCAPPADCMVKWFQVVLGFPEESVRYVELPE